MTEVGGTPTQQEEDDRKLVAALQAGDERAFEALVERYHSSLVRVAMIWVRDRAVAEEVAQETWLGVVKGIDRFEGRSSLKTWLFRILANRARTRGQREARSIPLSALLGSDGGDEPTVSPERFLDSGDGRPGPWAVPPESWARVPEEALLGKETQAVIEAAIAELPPRQQEVITLRDVEGLDSPEVADYLEGALSEKDRRRFEAHIADCPHCTNYVEQIRLTVRATGGLTEEQLDPHARDELLVAFRGWNAD